MPEHPTAVAEHATTTLTNAEDAPTSSALSSNEITTSTDPASAPVPKRSRTQIPYVPRYRSGAYALLVALYELGIRDTGISKTVLIRHAQPHSQHSFVEPEVGTRYTAWSSMRTLLAKELIVAEGKPARYRLTDSGWQLAEQLVHAEVISQEADLATRIDTEGMPTTRRVRRSLRLSLTSSKSALNTQPDQPEHGAMQTPTGYGSTSLIEPMASPPHHYRWSALVQKSTALLAATPSKQSPARKFCYLLLNARDQPVNDPSRAEQLFDRKLSILTLSRSTMITVHVHYIAETGIRRYRILYTQANATHPTARLVFRPMPAPNQPDHIVGYLEEGICLAHITRDLDRLPTRPVLSPIQNTLSTTKQTASTDEWTLPPHTFDIILLLDSREMTKRSDRTFIQRELEQRGIQVETRNLELGDVLWVARSKDRRLGGELILDVIIERKCMSDLVASIKDGRYYEQKVSPQQNERGRSDGTQSVDRVV
jgi:crossover junction endonuclease MUS81